MAMASSFKFPLVFFLSSLFFHATLGEIVCENMPKDVCAFSIASSGKRCLLETSTLSDGNVEYQCRTSEVVVERITDYIETDECVTACGVDRKSVGISSDALLEPQFAAKLCSPECFQNCPNIVDLYFNLAAGEGAYLPDLCKAHQINHHRVMLGLLSSGVAPGPIPATSSDFVSPASAPSSM